MVKTKAYDAPKNSSEIISVRNILRQVYLPKIFLPMPCCPFSITARISCSTDILAKKKKAFKEFNTGVWKFRLEAVYRVKFEIIRF